MEWDPDFLYRSPLFETLRTSATGFGAAWPALPELQRVLDAGEPRPRNADGVPLRLVPQGRGQAPAGGHEARVRLRGELEVRERSWHDLLNVLAWRAWPRSKAALNGRHCAEEERQRAAGVRNRGPVRDALTLLDESGMVVAAADPGLAALLLDWRWKDLFWTARPRLAAGIRFHAFGHALCEKGLNPFRGITARAVVLEVEPDLLAAPLPAQRAELDARLASVIADPARLQSTRELAVVPVLGIPGWWPGNEREDFYDDTGYFRPGRARP